MNTSNERNELIMKAVVDMNGDWKTGIQNMRISSGIAECLFSDNSGYWATISYWDHLCAGERATDGSLTPICTIAEFEEAAAEEWGDKIEPSQVIDISKVYCPTDSPDVELYLRMVGFKYGEGTRLFLKSLLHNYKNKYEGRTCYLTADEDSHGISSSIDCKYLDGLVEFKSPLEEEQQSVVTPKVDLSQMYCSINSPDIEAFKKLVEKEFDSDTLSKLQERIDWCRKRDYIYGVRLSEDGVTFAKLCWYQHESDYIEFKAPKVNYEELTFGELPRDEQLRLVEHVLDGGKIERYEKQGSQWSDKFTGTDYKLLCFVDNKKYRIKHVEPITEKELFLREAKHYESIEQMFDSGKFKLVADNGEE